jgi:hypothetical protein
MGEPGMAVWGSCRMRPVGALSKRQIDGKRKKESYLLEQVAEWRPVTRAKAGQPTAHRVVDWDTA